MSPTPSDAPYPSGESSEGSGRGQGDASPWAATRRPRGERVTTRSRRMAEGLPDWEPLPPGETVVRRPGSLS
ncbi:hypothetical protein ABZV77_06165 [Streptomyces sp. NPDC004732]|uniref:hypothetical protein n=1 Tax=Streptomyces sp. NPDC004732 TaxID=3154290 RepID=UPI0033AE821D